MLLVHREVGKGSCQCADLAMSSACNRSKRPSSLIATRGVSQIGMLPLVSRAEAVSVVPSLVM